MACGLTNALTPSVSYIVDPTETAICFNGSVYVPAKKSLASRPKTTQLYNIMIVFMCLVSSAYAAAF